ncbi:hypothetical protein N7449_005227 [Penicillium cf. viridicatum]|uniref:C6 transcription factor n=1 Tax=Penicillium cf. viridicatum TaxID=2972119 RepID=A0A9W9SYT5_9EURO|nr:hypothetical protein N7449_005227 [Penicillium cf. viridicatum]
MAALNCNEQQPCHNCIKYQSNCIFVTDLGQQRRNPVHPKSSMSKAGQSPSTSVIGAVESLPVPPLCDLARTAGFEPRDLELMHHFSTSVAKTLSYRNDIQDVWAISLPKEAYSCDYLMHGLLAISSLHLSFSSCILSNREKRRDYADLSTYHLHRSLAGFRERLANISTENCVPLFGHSSLMVINVCAQSALESGSQPGREHLASHIDMLMKIFNMCRGVESILAPYRSEIFQSSLSSLLHDDYRLTNAYRSHHNIDRTLTEEPPFADLVNLIQNEERGSQKQNEYLDALTKLRTAFRFMHTASQPLEPGAAFVWPIMLQRDSIRLFMHQTPLSLVLLAHYCIILHYLDGYWFLHGWHKALLTEITETLPSDLKTWVVWPRKECWAIEILGQ